MGRLTLQDHRQRHAGGGAGADSGVRERVGSSSCLHAGRRPWPVDQEVWGRSHSDGATPFRECKPECCSPHFEVRLDAACAPCRFDRYADRVQEEELSQVQPQDPLRRHEASTSIAPAVAAIQKLLDRSEDASRQIAAGGDGRRKRFRRSFDTPAHVDRTLETSGGRHSPRVSGAPRTSVQRTNEPVEADVAGPSRAHHVARHVDVAEDAAPKPQTEAGATGPSPPVPHASEAESATRRPQAEAVDPPAENLNSSFYFSDPFEGEPIADLQRDGGDGSPDNLFAEDDSTGLDVPDDALQWQHQHLEEGDADPWLLEDDDLET